MPNCGSCNAEIRWARTVNGRRVPLDATPVDPATPGAGWLDAAGVAHFSGLAPAADAPRYLSHFATCPHAARHRKGKGAT